MYHWQILLQTLQATEGQTEELRGHVIIAGFGRVGQIIGQLLAERLIPFVAVDVRMDCVQVGLPLPLSRKHWKCSYAESDSVADARQISGSMREDPVVTRGYATLCCARALLVRW